MTPEPQRCPNGHAASIPDARFCTVCGLPFSPPATLSPAPRPDAPGCAGHPGAAAVGTCPRCGTFTCAECLRRGPDGTELCITCLGRQASQLPWDNRASLGTLRAFWRTSIQIITRPTETFGAASPAGGIGSSLWFTIVAQLFGLGTTMGLYMLFAGAGAALALTADKKAPDAPGALAIAGIAVAVVLAFAIIGVMSTVAGLLINAGLDHLVLSMIGANPKSFEVTLRGAALSNAPALLGLIPICGPYVYLVWMYVARVFAYRGLHRISTGHAAAGALIVPGVFFTLGAMGYFLLIATSIAMGGR